MAGAAAASGGAAAGTGAAAGGGAVAGAGTTASGDNAACTGAADDGFAAAGAVGGAGSEVGVGDREARPALVWVVPYTTATTGCKSGLAAGKESVGDQSGTVVAVDVNDGGDSGNSSDGAIVDPGDAWEG